MKRHQLFASHTVLAATLFLLGAEIGWTQSAEVYPPQLSRIPESSLAGGRYFQQLRIEFAADDGAADDAVRDWSLCSSRESRRKGVDLAHGTIRQEALDDFKRNWDDIWPDMRYYTDYREMLDREKPDLVSVATSDHLHADITVDAANGGARAILCEKPIATTLADVDRMIAATATNSVLLSIEHTRRWRTKYHAARELIRTGELGPLRTISANMFSNRSMLFRNGTHVVDMICFYAESDPQWVFAELEEGFEHFTEYLSDGGRDPATDPSASAYIHFSSGIRAFYNSVKIPMSGSQMELVCEDGTIEISDVQATVVRGTDHWTQTRTPIVADEYLQAEQLGAVAELIHLLEQGGELVSPASEARKTVEILLAVLKSHELGNVRVDLPLK